MLREATFGLVNGDLSRCQFLVLTKAAGVSAAAASQLVGAASAQNADIAALPPGGDFITLKNATGGKITCETLRAWGVSHVFGNTGAYEAGFVDALVDYPDIQYVLGLHEGPVVAMADGYARITGKTAFVNVHSITGAANALGLIVNAHADNSPMVISVGFSASSGENLGVFTETAKVEAIAELYTKLSFRASNPNNLATSLRRSLRLASATPPGPVFLGVNADVWSGKIAKTRIIPAARSAPAGPLHPGEDDIERAAAMLARARNPLLVAGAELPRWGGLNELAAIADRLGAVVSGDTSSSRSAMGFASSHPRYLGAMRGRIRPQTAFDVVVLAGASRLSLARRGHPLIPERAQIIEIGVREEHLARGYPVDHLIYADARLTLAGIDQRLSAMTLDDAVIERRRREGEALKAKVRAPIIESLQKVWDDAPIAPERLAAEIDRAIEPAAIVVTEGVSSDRYIWDHVQFDQDNGGRRHLISSGGSLGWGVGAALGAKFAAPNKSVYALVGDGSFQFGLQALWTAQRHNKAIVVIIFNNLAYQANRWAIAGLKGRGAKTGRYIGINLDDPAIDHVAMASGYGVEGERVSEPGELTAALARAVRAGSEGRSYVLDVVIAKRGPGADAAAWHE
jgi:thiamine pyrophosphate-dependent acetolactate synthase large subunit-like protein